MAEDDVPGVDEEIDAEIDAALMESLLDREEIVGRGHDIEKDIEAVGPLARYLTDRRQAAVKAIKAFPDFDIDKDRADIRTCQEAVRMYLHVLLWVGAQFKAAAHAEETINRDLSPVDQPRDD